MRAGELAAACARSRARRLADILREQQAAAQFCGERQRFIDNCQAAGGTIVTIQYTTSHSSNAVRRSVGL